jgi:aspartate/methionine/tyrosine aminotransferase
MSLPASRTQVQPLETRNVRQRFRSDRTAEFTESVIREMSRIAVNHNAVNLAQGFPDFAAPAWIKTAAQDAIANDYNQYPITWGIRPLRAAIAEKYRKHYGLELEPEREVTVCCGATEGMVAALLAVVNAGDEIIVFEPYYENYHPDMMLCGAERRIVQLHTPHWTFDPDELRAAFTSKTKAIIINTPNNPTGKVFSHKELALIAELCVEHDVLCITDEIYEHIVYDNERHFPIITFPGMRERSILVNSMSKTYSVTGWRVGWVLAAPDLTDTIRKVHDFLTVGAATPLQHAGVLALSQPGDFYLKLAEEYKGRRDHLIASLELAGFKCFVPKGAYYVMTDISGFGFASDTEFVMHMIRDAGVAAVPGSSFFHNQQDGAKFVRFCFCKKYETLEEAGHRLRRL